MTRARPSHAPVAVRLRALALGLLAPFAVSACAGRAPAAPASPTLEPAVAPAAKEDELAIRLSRLRAELEAARERHHVPGMAIAVVRGDEVVLAEGFGLADLEAKTPASETTVFAIGSSTKAFTSTLVGMLVDDGKLAWDEPVGKQVPELKLALQGAEPGAELTLRDALCHRSGFTRMSMLWYAGAVDRNEMLTLASKAEPWAKHREKFLYNNVIYAAAGEASARAAGKPWDELLQERILDPLGMATTTTDIAKVNADPRRAKGYTWESEAKRFKPLPVRPIESAAPAGAIFSNVVEMASWLRFQLHDGEVDGKRLIAAATLAQTRSPQMKVAPGMDYGLGWFLGEHDGKTVVQYGGNIDGYAAMVAMIPEEKLGFVLLTNTSFTPLQSASMEIVWDAMLGDLPAPGATATTAPSEDLDRYTGSYLANFGPFSNEKFRVTASSGKLFVDVPGQMNFELKPPGDDGRRAFAMTDQIAVSFVAEGDGKADVLRLHQGGLDFELNREGFVPPAEVPIAKLQPYVGAYVGDPMGTAKVLVRNNRLAVDVPKQMIYELHPPDDEGKWRFRVKNDIAIEFEAKGDGPPAFFTLHQAGQALKFTRDPKAKALAPPTLEALAELRKSAKVERALAKVEILEMRGTMRMPQSAVSGEVTIHAAADGRYAMTVDLGKFGKIRNVVLGDRAFSELSFAPTTEHLGKYLAQAIASHPLALHREWSKTFDEVEVAGSEMLDGRRVHRVVLRKGALPPIAATVDAKTGDVIGTVHSELNDGAGAIPTTTELSRFRTVQGMRIPMRLQSSNEPVGKTIVELSQVRRFEGDPTAIFQ